MRSTTCEAPHCLQNRDAKARPRQFCTRDTSGSTGTGRLFKSADSIVQPGCTSRHRTVLMCPFRAAPRSGALCTLTFPTLHNHRKCLSLLILSLYYRLQTRIKICRRHFCARCAEVWTMGHGQGTVDFVCEARNGCWFLFNIPQTTALRGKTRIRMQHRGDPTPTAF